MLVTSISDAGAGRLKTLLVAEIEMGMLRFWHFLATTAVAKAKMAADLTMTAIWLAEPKLEE